MTFKRLCAQSLTAALMLTLTVSARGQAIAQFIAPVTYTSNGANNGPSMYWSVAGDFDGDGHMDLAAADGVSVSNILGFSVVFGNANGGFGAPISQSVGVFVRTLRAADFNHDGRADLLVVATSGTAAIFLGKADRSFSSPIQIPLPLSANDATIADFNSDGVPDIVFPGDLGYAIAINNGDGTFNRAKLLPEATPTYWAVAEDFNRDGKQDFTGAGGIGGDTYLGNGDGTFQAPFSAGFIATSGTVAGDFNGDGNIDLATITATPRQDGSNYGFQIAMGFGDGTFLPFLQYIFGNQPIRGIVAGDFNNDGLTDLATYFTGTGTIRVLAGDTQRWLGAQLWESPFMPAGVIFGADVDGNGSTDLVLSTYTDYAVFRNTHGDPPLLAGVTLTPAFVIGGATTSAVAQLGGAASANGAAVTLTSSDPSLAWFPAGANATISPGDSSTTIGMSTAGVVSPTTVTISALSNGISQSAVLSLVPSYSLAGLSISPARQYGIFNVRGTITLNNPADTAGTVALSSANSAIASVPSSVTVPAGAISVDFPVVLTPVTADTPVAITASRGDVAVTSSITVLKPVDAVAVTRAILTQKISDLRVEATSTSASTTITVYNALNGALLGTLDNAGGGKYKGDVFLSVPVGSPAPTIVLKSALGGTTSSTVQLK